MKKILFLVLFFTSGLFANPNDFLGILQQILTASDEGMQSNSKQTVTQKSLSEEANQEKAEKQRQEANKQVYIRQLNEKLIPRIKNLNTFNDRFYEKYFVKKTDTPEAIDEKFKNLTKLHMAMIRDYEAAEAEYRALDEAKNNICKEIDFSYCANLKISTIRLGSPQNANYLSMYGFDDQDYERYLREAYSTYDLRQKQYAEEKAIEAKRIQIAQDNEKQKLAIAAERKRVQPLCQKWRNDANKKVYSLGVGDSIIYVNGGQYTIEAINKNTFTVLNPALDKYITAKKMNIPDIFLGSAKVPSRYLYLEKDKCILPSAIKSAPSPLCYQ